MDRDIVPSTARGLIPPRPNLGPEPWPEDSGRPSVVVLSVLALTVLFLVVLWRLRVRRSRKSRSNPEAGPVPTSEPDPSPRARLIASAEAVRSAIADSEGPGWASKTTEELAREPMLLGRLGTDRAGRLVELFRASDRAKFAGEDPESVEEWVDWAGRLLDDWSAGDVPKGRQITSVEKRGRAIGRR